MTALSIIIPVYNRRELLSEALESVLNQTEKPHEIIVADDGSRDGSEEAAREILGKTGENLRWKVLKMSHTGLAGRVRNRAVAASEGNWIAFLDSDDLWAPEKLARQTALARENRDLRLIHTREVWLRKGKVVSQKTQTHRREGDVYEDSLGKCIIGPSTVMIRRDLWEESGGFREDLEIAEDYELWIRITARDPVGYIDEPLVTKRAGEWEQLSEKYGQIEKFRLAGLENLVASGWFARHGVSPERESLAVDELARKCHIYALGCEKRGRSEEAAAWHRKGDMYGLIR